MKQHSTFTIPFVGLKQGPHRFEYSIDDTFFDDSEQPDDFNSIRVAAVAEMTKKSNSLEFDFSIEGSANVNCDLTNEPFDQSVVGSHKLVVNFGDNRNDDDDSLLILPHGSYEIDLWQYFYDLILLSIPAKRVHPGVEDGTLDSDILKRLEELAPHSPEDQDNDKSGDPRWDALKDIVTDK